MPFLGLLHPTGRSGFNSWPKSAAPLPKPLLRQPLLRKESTNDLQIPTKNEEGGPDFEPPTERIGTFDSDATLWCEQPLYFQALFIFDRVKPFRTAASRMEDLAAIAETSTPRRPC